MDVQSAPAADTVTSPSVSDAFAATASPVSDRLPLSGLLAIAVTAFTVVLTETLPAGLLPQIAASLRVSTAAAGQLVGAFALGALLCAVPLIVATRGWRRRPLLLMAISGCFVFNTLTALSNDYTLTLVARFIGGVATGLVWGLLAGYARRMVAPALQGRALALAMLGTPVALSLGLPAATWLGTLMGWRLVFGMVSVLVAIVLIWVRATVPDFPGQKAATRLPLLMVLQLPGMRSVLAVILVWMLAHTMLYTYIAPLLSATGLNVRVDAVLLVFGLSALPGIWLTGLLIERHLRSLVLVSIAAFAIVALGLGLTAASQSAHAFMHQSWLLYASIALWGICFGGAPTLLQTAAADIAGEHQDVAQAMLITVWNLSIALGSLGGGLVLQLGAVRDMPWVTLVFIAAAAAITWAARSYGFRAGPRNVF